MGLAQAFQTGRGNSLGKPQKPRLHVVRKSGDADFRKKRQATPAGYDNNAEKFQTEVGALPGATNGVVTPGDGETVLAGP